MPNKDIIVSVFCPTYNHSDYIEQCLNSIVNQKTNFQFEVFVQDDASTDNSQEIIKKIAEKHSCIIPLLHKENIYSKGKNLNEYVFKNARGKYIAICEGDDYWTDINKLQKQVDFLEKNENISICGHRHKNIDSNNQEMDKIIWDGSKCPEYFDIPDAISSVIIHPNTWVFRNHDFKFHSIFTKLPAGDDPLLLMILNNGKGYCFKEVMSVYRWHNDGNWSPLTIPTKLINQLIYNFNVHHFCDSSYIGLIHEKRKTIKENFIYQCINDSTHYNVLKAIIVQLLKWGIPKSFLIKLYFKYVFILIKHKIKIKANI